MSDRRRSTVGLVDPFVEGSDESRKAAHMELMRKVRIQAARAKHGWKEIRPDRIERRGKLVVDLDTERVYEPIRAEVWANGNPANELNAASVSAFVVEELRGAEAFNYANNHLEKVVAEAGAWLYRCAITGQEWVLDTTREWDTGRWVRARCGA